MNIIYNEYNRLIYHLVVNLSTWSAILLGCIFHQSLTIAGTHFRAYLNSLEARNSTSRLSCTTTVNSNRRREDLSCCNNNSASSSSMPRQSIVASSTDWKQAGDDFGMTRKSACKRASLKLRSRISFPSFTLNSIEADEPVNMSRTSLLTSMNEISLLFVAVASSLAWCSSKSSSHVLSDAPWAIRSDSSMSSVFFRSLKSSTSSLRVVTNVFGSESIMFRYRWTVFSSSSSSSFNSLSSSVLGYFLSIFISIG